MTTVRNRKLRRSSIFRWDAESGVTATPPMPASSSPTLRPPPPVFLWSLRVQLYDLYLVRINRGLPWQDRARTRASATNSRDDLIRGQSEVDSVLTSYS